MRFKKVKYGQQFWHYDAIGNNCIEDSTLGLFIIDVCNFDQQWNINFFDSGRRGRLQFILYKWGGYLSKLTISKEIESKRFIRKIFVIFRLRFLEEY